MNDEHIQILLVEDNPGDALLVREMVRTARLGEVNLRCVNRLATAMQHLEMVHVGVALLDLPGTRFSQAWVIKPCR